MGVFIYIALLLFYCASPLLGIIPLLFFSSKEKRFIVPTLILVSFTFSMLAFCADTGGSIPTDLNRYRDQYQVYADYPFGYMFDINILFNSITWFLAHYITAEERFVGMFWVFVSNLFLMLSIKRIVDYFVVRKSKIQFFCYISTIFIVPLAIQNELLKQVSATCVVLYAVSILITNGKQSAANLLYVVSILIHPSSAIFFIFLLFIRKQWFQSHIGLLFACSLFLSQVNILRILSLLPFNGIFAERLEHYANFTEWGGSKRFYMVLIFYAFLVFRLLRYIKIEKYRVAIMALVTVLCVLLMNMANSHNFARFINTLYPFFAIVVTLSISVKKRPIRSAYCNFIIVCLILSNCIQYYSNMQNNYYLTYMDNNIMQLIGASVKGFLK